MMNGRIYSQEEKEKYVEEFNNSNENQTTFARTRGIPEATFRGWLKYQNHGDIDFGSISLDELQNEDNIFFSFKCQNISIELKKDFDKEMLKKIMEVIN